MEPANHTEPTHDNNQDVITDAEIDNIQKAIEKGRRELAAKAIRRELAQDLRSLV